MKTTFKTTVLAALLLGIGVLGANAIMTPQSFSFTGPGADGPIDATALFSFSGNTLTITLNNLEANPTAAGQLISGITFDLVGATGASLTSASGVLANIGTGVLNGGAPASLPHWGMNTSGSLMTLLQTAGPAAQGGSPVDMIIGPDGSGNPNSFNPTDYPNANPSITGNHQPSVLGTATFILTFTGTPVNLTDVTMDFGTGPDSTTPGTRTPPSVPDGGSTAILLGSAMVGLGSLRVWFRRK